MTRLSYGYTPVNFRVFPWLSISDGVTGLKELAFLRDLAEQELREVWRAGPDSL